MTNRSWDPKNKYVSATIRDYNHWILDISFRQHTLGCFIIFAKRDIEKISDLNDEEIIEFKNIIKEYEEFISALFSPDRYNYLQLGNELHHLHFHCIPRYSTERIFAGKKWIDKSYGHPPKWKNKETNIKIIMKIKKEVFQYLYPELDCAI